MRQGIDIKDVISKTTSDVPLEALQKKGFKKVKVLDKQAIDQMIREAVDKVVEERLKEATDHEREQIQRETKAEFDKKMSDFRETQNLAKSKEEHLTELRSQLERREQDLEERLANAKRRETELEQRLQAKEAEIAERERQLEEARSGQTAQSGELDELKSSLATILETVKRGGVGGGGGENIAGRTDAAAIEALIRNAGQSSDGMENNMESVEVKQSTSKSVNSTLEKLKSLKKGS